MKVITRFAPSPTGMLHAGGARTALFEYLWAKANGGDFLLRIEDTDKKRQVDGAEENIVDGLKWLDLDWDNKEIVVQSERIDKYKKYIDQLVKQDDAYYCFCSEERLKEMREQQINNRQAPKYDRKCLSLDPEEAKKRLDRGEKCVVRLKIPDEGYIEFKDLVRGKVAFECKNIDDQVLLKSDGYPTYHLAKVVDDHEMGVNYVIRGEEWLSSTPKHIILYQYFGWEIPQFVHLSLFMKKGGGKLSKREGAMSVLEFKKQGYLKEAMINFMVLLGWNPKNKQEFFTLNELIKIFDLKNVNKANPIFDIDKLDYLNGHYIREKNIDELYKICVPFLKKAGLSGKEDYVKKVIALEQSRLKKLSDLPDMVDYFFKEPDYLVEMLLWKDMTTDDAKKKLGILLKFLESLDDSDFMLKSLETKIIEFIERESLGTGDTLWPMRVALSGKKASPSPFEIAVVLGKDETVSRIKKAVERL